MLAGENIVLPDLGVRITAYALDRIGTCGVNVKWSFDSTTGTLTISGSGAMTNYQWGKSPFYGNQYISKVIIKDDVTSIGDYAFEFCSGIKEADIPNSIERIGDSAFWGCYSLTDVNIGDNVKTIDDGAFFSCTSFTEVTFKGDVPATIMGDRFSRELYSVLPSSVSRCKINNVKRGFKGLTLKSNIKN